ncbi:hypothetical protein DFH09DRAFT_1035136, partial [Mycena vulgaris]
MNNKDTYTNLLLGKGYGYPLYIPEPTTTPVEYHKHGVRVGDVGFLNDQGAFDYLFTIAAKKEDPRNELLLRDTHIKDCAFEFMELDADVRLLSVFQAGYSESTESIHGVDFEASAGASVPNLGTLHSGMKISCSSEGGVALLLPHGAFLSHYPFLKRILKHALTHGLTWLEFLEKLDAPSTLYLITGCYKSSAWGITVSAKHSNAGGVTMQLLAHEITDGQLKYSWHTSGGSHVHRAGPGPRPKQEKDNKNQCIFIQGYIIAKKTNLLQKLLPFNPVPGIDALEGSNDTKSALDEVKKSSKTS